MSAFGDNLDMGQVSPDNPLGIKQAPDEAANPGQPVGDGAAGTGNAGEVENIVNDGGSQFQESQSQQDRQPSKEPDIENVDVNDDYEKKVAFIKKKFKSQEDFERSIEELQRKLGRENENPTFETQEDVINYYIELEKELGQRSQNQNVNQYQDENQQLKQQVNSLQNTVQQLMFQLQNQQNPQQPRDPNTGRFISPQGQEQQGQVDNENFDISFDDIDADQFLSELYEKGPNAESFKKVVMNVAEKIADSKFQKLQKSLEEQHKQQQALQLKSHYDRQVESIKQKYGEQEFEKYKQNMLQLFRKYPMYLNPQLFPNGFEIVFNEARQMTNNFQQQQNVMQNQQQANTAQKMAARMPKSNPSQRFASRQPSQEEIEKMQIFQSQNTNGIFG